MANSKYLEDYVRILLKIQGIERQGCYFPCSSGMLGGLKLCVCALFAWSRGSPKSVLLAVAVWWELASQPSHTAKK